MGALRLVFPQIPADTDVLVYLADTFARTAGRHLSEEDRSAIRGHGLADVRTATGLKYIPLSGSRISVRVMPSGLEIIAVSEYLTGRHAETFTKEVSDYLAVAQKIADAARTLSPHYTSEQELALR